MKGYIYIIRCTLNDMYYIGSTTTSLEQRFRSHLAAAKNGKSPIARMINLYGKHNFNIQELYHQAISHKREILKIESEFIELYKRHDGNALNASVPLSYLKNIDDYYKNWYNKNKDKVKKSVLSNRAKNKKNSIIYIKWVTHYITCWIIAFVN